MQQVNESFGPNRQTWTVSTDRMVFGIRSRDGLKYLENNPFIMGAQIPLAKDEELYCYLSPEDLAKATKERDRLKMGSYYLARGLVLGVWIGGLLGGVLGVLLF